MEKKTTRPDPSELAPYAEARSDLIPLHAHSAVDGLGRQRGKSPRDVDWRRQDYSGFDAARHMALGRNVGYRLSDEDLVVDADPRNYAAGDDPLDRLVADVGLDPAGTPRVDTGSGGCHLYLRKPPGTPTLETLKAYPGLEFKARGRQVVAAGSLHPDTRRHYRWDPVTPGPRDAPQAPERLIAMIRRPAAATSAAQVGGAQHTPEHLAEMLAHVDPCDFRDHTAWLEMMMSCHHATAGEGSEEFAEWSTRDPEFAAHRATILRRWDSLHSDGLGKITYRTLYKHMHARGQDGAIPARDAAEDFAGLEPAEVPDAASLAAGDDAKKGPLEAMNDTYYAVDDGGKFRIYADYTDETVQPPRRFWVRYARTDFENLLANRRAQDGDKTVPIAQKWIEWGGRRTVRGVVFDPEQQRPGFLNLWSGWAVQPEPGDWSLLRELVRGPLSQGVAAHADYILDWAAYMFQHPGRQAEVALCFRGAKGTGKGTFGRALYSVAGRHGLHISSPAHLTGRFNAHLRDCVSLFADEAFWAGDKQGEATLKQLVTEPYIMIEGKGQNAEMGRNLTHIVVASNSDWVVPASVGDERRFAVFDVDDTRRGDKPFFLALNRQLEAGGLEGFLHDMLRRDISGWHPRDAVPQTVAGAEQAVHSAPPVTQWLLRVLGEGSLPFEPACGGDWSRGPVWAYSHEAYSDFRDGERSRGNSHVMSPTAFGMALNKIAPGAGAKRRVRVPPDSAVPRASDGRAWAFELPSLPELADRFRGELDAIGRVRSRARQAKP